jgi:formate dehydrogenase subunit gamma
MSRLKSPLFVALLAWTLVLAVLMSAQALAAVPNQDAVPAYAEEQTMLQIEKDAPEPGWGSLASGRSHVDRHSISAQGLDPEHVVIVQRGGNTWRTLRNGPIAMLSGTMLLVVPLLIYIFYRTVGPARLQRPESGRRLLRFTAWQRAVHWSLAISFVVLAISGVIILFGKNVLLPLVGHTAFSWLAVVSKYLHNFVGPLFIVCSVLMFVTFMWQNFFRRWDWEWIKKGGGLLSHSPVPSGYFNTGEKFWFWGGVVLLGLVMSVSGLLLDFVNLGQTRYVLQLANYLHVAGATIYMVGSMGHIYLGTVGTPGAYEGMRHGTVDEEWARTHHQLWHDEVKTGRPVTSPVSSSGSGPRAHGAAANTPGVNRA